jgi:hypothetical protein
MVDIKHTTHITRVYPCSTHIYTKLNTSSHTMQTKTHVQIHTYIYKCIHFIQKIPRQEFIREVSRLNGFIDRKAGLKGFSIAF